jgi:tRNA-splicing ligase RtcB
MSRGEATRTLSQRAIDDEYREAGIVVNADGRVPLDEAAPCYKPSEDVVAAVVGAGLAEVEHRLWPLASLKGVDERRRGRKGRRQKPRGDAGDKKTSEHY